MMMTHQLSTVCLILVVMINWVNLAEAEPKSVTVDAAFITAQHIVLFSDNEALHIDKTTKNEVETTDAQTHKLRSDLNLKAALEAQGTQNRVFYFGPKFAVNVNLKTGKGRKLRYAKSRKFLKRGGPNAAARKGNDAVIFRGCRMSQATNWKKWEKPVKVNNLQLPCKPDAAWSEGNDMVLLKGNSVWHWNEDGSTVGPCPFTDYYSISSWNLNPNPDVTQIACPAGWKFHCKSSRCFKLFTEDKNWHDARSACEQEGGVLAKIESQEIQNLLGGMVQANSGYYWIGLRDIDDEGNFTWLDGTGVTQYSLWNTGEPNDHSGAEDCGHMINSSPFGWNDLPCHATIRYICQRVAN